MNDLFDGTLKGEERIKAVARLLNIADENLSEPHIDVIKRVLKRAEKVAILELRQSLYMLNRGFNLGKY